MADKDVEDVIEYKKIKCPRCNSDKVLIYHTEAETENNLRIRRHKCQNCQTTFKSVETLKIDLPRLH